MEGGRAVPSFPSFEASYQATPFTAATPAARDPFGRGVAVPACHSPPGRRDVKTANTSRREITELLAAHADGDPEALRQLVPLVYDDLRRIARRQLAGEAEGHTLNTTAVVHEAYLRIADRGDSAWPSRAHFFAFAAQVMRHVLTDHARKRTRQKRGGGAVHLPLDRVELGTSDPTTELLALDEALTRLSEKHERMGRVVECRLFAGMTAEDVARALGVSLSTVERDWRAAKAYLYRALSPEGEAGESSTAGPETGAAPA